MLLSMTSYKSFAYDIAVENSDGVTIYYKYINEGKELEVTYQYFNQESSNEYYRFYHGNINIPEEVTFMGRNRKVTSIGYYAFSYCPITSVTIPNSVTNIAANAFKGCGLNSVIIPNSVVKICDYAFAFCTGMTSVTMGNNVKEICDYAFAYCYKLTSAIIPNSVETIGKYAFLNCESLTTVDIGHGIKNIMEYAFSECYAIDKVIIRDIASWCNINFGLKYRRYQQREIMDNASANPLSFANHIYSAEGVEITELNIPEEVDTIKDGAFFSCPTIKKISFPTNLKYIGKYAFFNNGFETLNLSSQVSVIEEYSFQACPLSKITIPNSVTAIGYGAFFSSISVIISYIMEPFNVSGVFSQDTQYNATLFVPEGTIEKYKNMSGWKNFLYIEEIGTPPTPKKCEKPTIGYSYGKLTFTSSTEGATYHYSINDSDIQAGSGSEVQLAVTYNISVYAAKEGCENSETATATLCWIDAEPTTEGISNNVAHVRAKAVMIQSNGNVVSVSGADRGTEISIYDIAGKKVGSSIATSDITKIATSLDTGSIAIIRIGEKAVKILIK